MQRLWKSAGYWLVPHDLLSLLSSTPSPPQDHLPKSSSTHNVLAFSTSITNFKMSHRPIWWVHLLIEVFSCQIILACVKVKHKLAFTVIIIYICKVFLTLLDLLITTCYYNCCSNLKLDTNLSHQNMLLCLQRNILL